MRSFDLRKLLLFGLIFISMSSYGTDLETAQLNVQTFMTRGDSDAAKRALDRASINLGALKETQETLDSLRKMAAQYRTLGASTNAAELLKRSIVIAKNIDPNAVEGLLAVLGDTLGNIDNHGGASAAFIEQLSRIPKMNHFERAFAYTNLIKAEIRSTDNTDRIQSIVEGFKVELRLLENEKQVCDLKLQFAGTLLLSQYAVDYSQLLAQLLDDSQGSSGGERDKSFRIGFRGLLKERQGNFDEALHLTRLALMASLNKYSELTYRWQWQIGRIKTQMGDAKGAIENYQESIDTLSLVQGRLLKGSFVAFRERVLPVYSELIDLLLAQAQLSENHIERQTLLVSVQETIEAFNRSEILDYFNDDCVLPAVGTKLNAISNDTVVVYPVLLADRIVIIAKFPDGIHQVSSSVDRKEVLGLVSDFREGLEGVDESVEEIQESSEELYNYLVAPISEKLEAQNIKRLVFVPASVLRMIPMAALYDGESYLVEKYQIATTLGLTLTEPAQRKDITSSLLLGGISESVQGFAALPGVVSEVGAIKNRFGGDLVLNKEFRLDDIAKQLSIGGHSIVHLATHGVFESEASNSYLLAYDDKLSLDKLQDTLGSRRFLGDPLDLLVLSACETAAGNERAALGLAGVALKAGAKSTVASLWPISDEGTSRLMIDFYGYLEKGESKSGALRLAQINLIQDPVFEHPNFWSPFLLVGNWL